MAESPKLLEGDIVLYRTPEGAARIEVVYQAETFWLNQKKLAELFGVDVRTISYHLKEIFGSGELSDEATVQRIRRVRREGNREVAREIVFYNLDAIISVGYRVNSTQATRFRIWATQTLKEFVTKGFVLDDERLKLNKRFGKDYFDELLERIREIRASERRFYLKITDIYEQCSVDYDKDAELTTTFFKTVQNKLHWAVTGQTAAEIVAARTDSTKPTMGLTTWKQAPTGKIVKSDVSVAKNYLIESEVAELNRIVSMYLDYAENQAAKQRPMRMADWVERTRSFGSTSTRSSRTLGRFRPRSRRSLPRSSTPRSGCGRTGLSRATSSERSGASAGGRRGGTKGSEAPCGCGLHRKSDWKSPRPGEGSSPGWTSRSGTTTRTKTGFTQFVAERVWPSSMLAPLAPRCGKCSTKRARSCRRSTRATSKVVGSKRSSKGSRPT
jgi:hypothetical protein